MPHQAPQAILPVHHAKILQMNKDFVHWLSPLSQDRLDYILARASYQKQINQAEGVLLGYAHDVDYPDHKNLNWLRQNLDTVSGRHNFFYIDRVIISKSAQGRGLGRRLYDDIIRFAQKQNYQSLTCEVNIKPNNPISHDFHKAMGFQVIGEAAYPDHNAALRYYELPLSK